MALTEDDVRRIVREEIERSRVVPVHTTPQPPDFMAPCPHGCKPMTVCMSVNCPKRIQIT